MALLTINGRKQFFNCNTIELKSVSNGRWQVTYDREVYEEPNGDGVEVICEGRSFIVVGGRKSGGASNEWFCYHPEFYGENWIACKSMVEAIKLGVAY